MVKEVSTFVRSGAERSRASYHPTARLSAAIRDALLAGGRALLQLVRLPACMAGTDWVRMAFLLTT